MDVRDRVILITGAGGNLGSACAEVLLQSGARLALTDRSAEKLRTLSKSLGGPPASRVEHFAEVDLSNPASAPRLVSDIVARFGRLDGVANTVGMFRLGTFGDAADPGSWPMVFDINLGVAARVCAAALPIMKRQGSGSIVNVSSKAALRGPAGVGGYSAAKAAILRLTESIAAEYADLGVRANCVLPDTMDTPENRKAMPGEDPAKWVSPRSVAQVIAFLLSDAAKDVRAAAIPVGVSV